MQKWIKDIYNRKGRVKNINFDFKIKLTRLSDNYREFEKNFMMYIKDTFYKSSEKRHHNIFNHIMDFQRRVSINNTKLSHNDFNKYDIHYINFWMNIWNEINGQRPWLIFKNNRHTKGADIIIIPLTSLKKDNNWENKPLDKFDIIIERDSKNKLKKDSILRIRQIKSISKNRIWKLIWTLDNKLDNTYMYDLIDKNIKDIFSIE